MGGTDISLLVVAFFVNPVEYSSGFLYFFSSLAQCAAAFAALIAVFAVFRFQANGDIIKNLYEDINDWLVTKGRSSYIDHDRQGLIHAKIKAFSEQGNDAEQALVLYNRLKAVEAFPKTLAYNASKPLSHWAYICFFSLLFLILFEVTTLRTRGWQYLASVILITATVRVFFETKDFVQDCLKS